MKPSLGRIVIMKLTENQQIELDQFSPVPDAPGKESPAMIVHCSPNNEEGSTTSVKVFGINGKELYIAYASEGTAPGTWHEPPRV